MVSALLPCEHSESPHPTPCNEYSWTRATACRSTGSHGTAHCTMKVGERTSQSALTNTSEYTIPCETMFYLCAWHPFCKWSSPARVQFAFLALTIANYHPGGATRGPILYGLYLGLTAPWQHRLSSSLQCSDKKKNKLLGSSSSSAKRQSGLKLQCLSSLSLKQPIAWQDTLQKQ